MARTRTPGAIEKVAVVTTKVCATSGWMEPMRTRIGAPPRMSRGLRDAIIEALRGEIIAGRDLLEI